MPFFRMWRKIDREAPAAFQEGKAGSWVVQLDRVAKVKSAWSAMRLCIGDEEMDVISNSSRFWTTKTMVQLGEMGMSEGGTGLGEIDEMIMHLGFNPLILRCLWDYSCSWS